MLFFYYIIGYSSVRYRFYWRDNEVIFLGLNRPTDGDCGPGRRGSRILPGEGGTTQTAVKIETPKETE